MKKIGVLGLMAALAVTGAVAFLPKGVMAAEDSDQTISQGVYIGDVDVSGMTQEEAKKAVEDDMSEAKAANITLKVDDQETVVSAGDLGLSWANEEVVQEAAELGKSGNIIKRYKDKKDLENESRKYDIDYFVDRSSIQKVLEEKEDVFNREPTDAQLSTENGAFEVVQGENGIELNVEKSVKKILKSLKTDWDGKNTTIELAADIKEPECTTEDLASITDVLGTATTYYGSTTGRNKNVETGVEKLNGHILMPGEEFSVTDAVVPFTEENGYELAPSYESGKVVDSYGGGICQVSTTLYNAVLNAELEVLERHNHTMIVTYVDPSKDAAIAEGLMDLRFANNTDYPIYISGYAYGGELTFTIYGHETRDPNRTVEYVSETTGTTTADGVALYATDQPVGYLSQTQGALQGLTAVLWKYVTENGETTKEQVNSSTYQATPVCYDVGVNTDNPTVAAAIQSAIANNDLDQVQAIISGNYGQTSTATADQAQSESQAQDQTQMLPLVLSGKTYSEMAPKMMELSRRLSIEKRRVEMEVPHRMWHCRMTRQTELLLSKKLIEGYKLWILF